MKRSTDMDEHDSSIKILAFVLGGSVVFWVGLALWLMFR